MLMIENLQKQDKEIIKRKIAKREIVNKKKLPIIMIFLGTGQPRRNVLDDGDVYMWDYNLIRYYMQNLENNNQNIIGEISGVGSSADFLYTGAMFGYGMDERANSAYSHFTRMRKNCNNKPNESQTFSYGNNKWPVFSYDENKLKTLGYSRGTICALKLIKKIYKDKKYKDVKSSLFLFDPVPGNSRKTVALSRWKRWLRKLTFTMQVANMSEYENIEDVKIVFCAKEKRKFFTKILPKFSAKTNVTISVTPATHADATLNGQLLSNNLTIKHPANYPCIKQTMININDLETYNAIKRETIINGFILLKTDQIQSPQCNFTAPENENINEYDYNSLINYYSSFLPDNIEEGFNYWHLIVKSYKDIMLETSPQVIEANLAYLFLNTKPLNKKLEVSAHSNDGLIKLIVPKGAQVKNGVYDKVHIYKRNGLLPKDVYLTKYKMITDGEDTEGQSSNVFMCFKKVVVSITKNAVLAQTLLDAESIADMEDILENIDKPKSKDAIIGDVALQNYLASALNLKASKVKEILPNYFKENSRNFKLNKIALLKFQLKEKLQEEGSQILIKMSGQSNLDKLNEVNIDKLTLEDLIKLEAERRYYQKYPLTHIKRVKNKAREIAKIEEQIKKEHKSIKRKLSLNRYYKKTKVAKKKILKHMQKVRSSNKYAAAIIGEKREEGVDYTSKLSHAIYESRTQQLQYNTNTKSKCHTCNLNSPCLECKQQVH